MDLELAKKILGVLSAFCGAMVAVIVQGESSNPAYAVFAGIGAAVLAATVGGFLFIVIAFLRKAFTPVEQTRKGLHLRSKRAR